MPEIALPLRRPGFVEPPSAKPVAKPNRVKLTQRIAEQVPRPADGYLTIWDANLPGFGLRISSKGRRSWIAMYRVAGSKQVMETIGTLAAIPAINDARDLARQSFEQARRGVHPVEARKQPAAPEAYTLSKLIAEFIRKHHERRGSRDKTLYEARRVLNRALAVIGDKPVKQITKADVLLMVNKLADTRINKWRGNTKGGALSEAAGVLQHLRTCFRFAVAENLIDSDPTADVRNPLAGRRERERVLSEPELVALWRVCEDIGFPYGPILQLLLLTGQRKLEIGEMPWHELDLDNRVWHLPGSRTKNHHAHDVYLSDLAVEVIERLPRFGDFVFSSDGQKPVAAYSSQKPIIDERLQAILGKVEPWVMHDLRRSTATYMAELGVAPHVLDRVLNHVSGTIKGVARIYNRHQYSPERKAALDTWGKFVEELVYPERARANVIEMRR